MKSLSNNDAEKTAERLAEFSNITPDKRALLRQIVRSAPENITRDSQLSKYFASTYQQEEKKSFIGRPAIRIYASMAVVLVVLLGGGMAWFGWQNSTAVRNTQSSSQISVNGKVSNTINTITQQAQTELQTAQSATIDTANLDTINTQLGQMQEAVNEKF
ncbi:MAG: hypothetical protein U0516_02225 [Candidatus Saccharibacteria bacterium]